MDDRQELLDLRRLAELEARAGSSDAQEQEEPSSLAVAGNAAAKGVASFGDMFLNAPVNAYNVAKAGAVLAGDALGTDLRDTLEITPQPNLIEKGMRATGLISEEREPKTPGQRILDMAIQAGVGVAASPASGVAGVAKNIGIGLASGAAAGITKEATGSDLAATAVGMAVPLIARGVPSKANAPILKNPVKLQTAKEGMEAGYVVPPSYLKPSAVTNRLEGVGGKAAIKQQAQARNVEVTDALARKAIGLPEGTPITKEALEQVRAQAAQPYIEVNALAQVPIQKPGLPSFPQFSRANLLEDLKQARHDATAHFNHYNRTADPAVLAKAKGFQSQANRLETQLERVAQAAGRPELVEQLKEARTLYAKTYDIERALNQADGHVSAAVLGKLYAKGKPLSGELAVIGKFAKAFPDAVRDSAKIQSSGVSGTEAGMSAILGMGGAATAGPMGLLAGGLPLLRSPARSMLLSKGYQNRLLKEAPSLTPALYQSLLGGRAIAEAP